ncbi:MAG: aldehyde dehydrogenase family protein, partial [Sciscionella sp.]
MTSLADQADQNAGPGVSDFGAEDARLVVDRLRATFATGRTRSVEWRLRQLRGLLRLVTERESDIASALAADLGRNAHDSWFGDV